MKKSFNCEVYNSQLKKGRMTEFYDSLYTIRDYRVVNRSFIAAE